MCLLSTDKNDDASGDEQKETKEAGTKRVPHARGTDASPLSSSLSLLITDVAGSVADDGSGTVGRSSLSGRLQQARQTFWIAFRIIFLTSDDQTPCGRTIRRHDNLNTAALIIHGGVAAHHTKVDSFLFLPQSFSSKPIHRDQTKLLFFYPFLSLHALVRISGLNFKKGRLGIKKKRR